MDNIERELMSLEFEKSFEEMSTKYRHVMRAQANGNDMLVMRDFYDMVERLISDLELRNVELNVEYSEVRGGMRMLDDMGILPIAWKYYYKIEN